MERLLPIEAREPAVPHTPGSGAARTTLLTLLAVAVAAGAWVRFNTQIGALWPALAVPASLAGGQFADPAAPRELIEIGLLPSGQDKAAVADMGLPPEDEAALTSALDRGRLRLARLGLVDDSLALQGGHTIQISAGGYTRQVLLTRTPTVVTLPVGPVSTISFSTAEPGAVRIVGLTLTGPVPMPELSAGQVLSVGVIAQ
jgi:hypothetical protein